MENEIKVGEYVRTKRGIIDRVVMTSDNYIFLKITFFITEYGESCTFIKKTDIVKHSPNLIDLIQCGDVLRIKVQFHHEIEPYYTLKEITSKEDAEWKSILEQIDLCHYEIIEIYTKEMMESISYKVKE